MNENYLKAKVLFDLGRYNESIDAAKECLAGDSEDRLAMILLAVAYQRLQDNKSLLFWSKEILKLNGDDPIGHYYKAHALFDNRPNEALKHINFALSLSPNNADFYVFKAIILRKNGRYDLALAHTQQGLRIDPTQHNLLHEQAFILSLLNKGLESNSSSKKAIENAPDDWRAFVYSSQTAFSNGQGKKGMSDLREAIRLNPTSDSLRILYPIYLKFTEAYAGGFSSSVQLKAKPSQLYPTLENIIWMPFLMVYMLILSILALFPWFIEFIKESAIITTPAHRKYLLEKHKVVFRVNAVLMIISIVLLFMAIYTKQVVFLNVFGCFF